MSRSRILPACSVALSALLAALMASIALAGGKAYAEPDYQTAQLGETAAMEAQADDIASGTCGECTWVIDADGLLTIKPTNGVSGVLDNSRGRKAQDSDSFFPWYQFADQITRVRLENGIKAGSSVCGMFVGTGSGHRIESIDLGDFDTSNVTDMSWMFAYCGVSDTVKLNINTANVTDMSYMFGYSSLDGGWKYDADKRWDTSQVTTMEGMFYGIGFGGDPVDSLELPFDTENVVNMRAMFALTQFKRIDVSTFDTKNADMGLIFLDAYGIDELIVGSTFDFGRVNEMPSLGSYKAEASWWSMEAQQWFTPDEVKATRSGIADTYRSEALYDLSKKGSVELAEISFVADGSAKEPGVTVKYGDTVLSSGDYDVSYSNNVNAGTATVTVTGKGSYTGAATATFAITAPDGPAIDPAAGDPVKDGPAAWTRFAGEDAYGTMAKIVDAGWPDGSGAVVVATFDGYWDALTASGLAGFLGCPVLMTGTDGLSATTRSEIERLGAKTAFVAGGGAAVSAGVEAELSAMGLSVVRAAGDNAAGTARDAYEKSKAYGEWGKTAIVATADGYWDALAMSPYSYCMHAPIFLAQEPAGRGMRLDAGTLAAIRAGGFDTVLVAGGTAAVSADVESQLSGLSIERLAGETAVETSRAIASHCASHGMSRAKVAVATTDGYWDALTGAALCGRTRTPMVLASPANAAAAADGFVSSEASTIAVGYIFGGDAAVAPASEAALREATR